MQYTAINKVSIFIRKLFDRLIKENRLTFIKLATTIAVIMTVASLIIIIIGAKIIREKSIHDYATQDAKQISRFVFESLYSGMVNGWTKKEIAEAIQRLNKVEPGMKIKVLRGAPIIKEFGEIEGGRQEGEQSNIVNAEVRSSTSTTI